MKKVITPSNNPEIDQEKILVVDDTPTSLRFLVDLLTEQGYTVLPALSGQSALFGARAESPGLILLDIVMPDMNGYEVCQQLKADEKTRDIPIIFVSALDQTFDKVKGFEVGGVDYVSKPFQVEEILARIKTHLAVRRLQKRVEVQNIQLKQEVAERERTEAELREKSALLQGIMNNSPVGICAKDIRGKFIFGNKRFVDQLALSIDEITGKSNCDLYPEETADIFTRQDEIVIETGAPVEEEIAVVINNQVRNWLVTKFAVFDINGQTQSICGLSIDITERKQTEEILRERERFIQSIADASPAILYVYHFAQHRYIYTNNAICKMLGYTPAEIQALGHKFIDHLIHPQDVDTLAQSEDRLRNSQAHEIVELEYRMRHKNGEWRWLSSREIVFKRTADGQISEVMGAAQDITDRKQLEEQLRQSQKMEAIGHLAGGVAHHFNNLLTTIMGYVDLSLAVLPADQAIASDLQIVRKTAKRAAILTRQLLAFTRKQIIQPRILDLNTLILNIENMLRKLINESITLKTTLAPDLGRVKIDAGQFEQLLVNFVVNARDAMPDGGRLILETRNVTVDSTTVSGYSEPPPGRYVQLIVSDTGLGMAESIKARIFEPFFTTKEVDQGTGLGLSTCFGIVKQHHGYITVASEPEQGTAFYVYFPRCEERAATPEIEANGFLPPGAETILLVEDEIAVRRLAGRVLRQQGYTVLEANDGIEALHVLETQPGTKLDLLLADIVMPLMGGVELAGRLAAKTPQLKVLLISGHTEQVMRQEDILKVKGNLLLKPFTPAKLAQSVRAVLDEEERPLD